MSIVQLNLGASENDGAGQNLRSGGQVINANFAELDQRTTTAQASADTAGTKADSAQAKADAAIPAAQKGQPNGVASLDGSGVVPAGQLPSYVDDVLEFASLAAFPAIGETGKIYIATNTNAQYRWSGTQYIQLSASPGSTDAVPEGTINKYWTNARTIASVLTGLVTTNAAVIAATDTILVALGKLQKQISDAVTTISNKATKGANGDITSLSGLTTPLSISQGGTGATSLAEAQAALEINSSDVWGSQPIGALLAIIDNGTVASPPTNNANYRYIRLTAGDSYNSGILISESVSGSAPLVVATAVVNVSGSPFNGVTVNLINTERRFIRAGLPGVVQQDAIQNITGTVQIVGATPVSGTGALGTGSAGSATRASGSNPSNLMIFDASLSARTDTETRSKNMGATYYMRVR